MVTDGDKRKHRRLAIRLPLEYRSVERAGSPVFRTVTRNVSTGGVYFETDSGPFEVGSNLVVELVVPPGDGHFPTSGRIRGIGEVTRVQPLPDGEQNADAPPRRFGVAARFDEALQLIF